jgi:transketolase
VPVPGSTWTVDDPARLATGIRLQAVRMVAKLGLGYLGQALSSAEIVAALFAAAGPGVDRIVCSPGHYVIAFYAAAAETGLLPSDALDGYGQDGSALEAIGTERPGAGSRGGGARPFLDWTGGSLGQGLSAAAGFALADRLTGRDGRVFALLSDGELEEGQVWEAAMFAAHHGLDRLTVLIDANNSQVDGPVDLVMRIEPVAAKWESFGWSVSEVDGHDVRALAATISGAADGARPAAIVCRTSTRRGLENSLPPDADGHFIKLPADLAERAIAELTEVSHATRPSAPAPLPGPAQALRSGAGRAGQAAQGHRLPQR